MKDGDLVRSTILDDWQEEDAGIIGIIFEAYDTPKGLWYVRWMLSANTVPPSTLCHEATMEVIA